MKRLYLTPLLLSLLLLPDSSAQQRVDPRNRHERLLVIVPVVGTGLAADPKRPLFAPTRTASNGRGILGFTMQLSDNGLFALCEFVARDRAALQPILTANRPDVIVFEKGKATRAAIETEFRRFKANFNLDKMGVSIP